MATMPEMHVSVTLGYSLIPRQSFFTWFGLRPRRWWWILRSNDNGQTVATSETYSSADKRDQTLDRIVSDPSAFHIVRVNGRGSWWWRIVGHNGEIVAASETYASAWNRNVTSGRVADAFGWKIFDAGVA